MIKKLGATFQPRLATVGTRSYTTPAEQDDVVIIGGGPGGYVAAIKAGQLGMKVTCVEKRGRLGGTCLNVGCIPSKSLLNDSHFYHEVKHAGAKRGLKYTGLDIDLDAIMKHKATAVDGLTRGIEGLFKKNKVKYEVGFGSLLDANTVEVTAENGTKKQIKTKNIVIATGSDVMSLPTLPIDEQQIVSSTGALSLPTIPKSLIVVGGGVIGLELGSVWSRLGSAVEVIEFQGHICGGADKELGKIFQRSLTKQGLKFNLNRKVTGSRKEGGQVVLTTEAAAGGEVQEFRADVVLVAVGRRPYTDNLGLDRAGVKVTPRGQVETNAHWQTNVPNIYAIGDVITGPMLAHKAEEEGIAVVESLAQPGVGHVNYNAIPSVIYTHPEFAWVGATEEELVAKGIKFKKGTFPFQANSRARTNDDAEGMVKFLADAETDRLLGAHILGPNAGELISECVLALEYGASAEDVARTCHAHPTLSEATKEAAMATFNKPIHF